MEQDPQSEPLFVHTEHPHTPINVNDIHQHEQRNASFNQKVALRMTVIFSSMITFWIVSGMIVLWIIFQSSPFAWDGLPYPLLLTILNIPQISMMIALGVGQGVQARHQELQANEQYQTTEKIYHDLSEIRAHLSAQDAHLLSQHATDN